MSSSSSSSTFYLFLSNEMDTKQLTPSTLTICKAPKSNRITMRCINYLICVRVCAMHLHCLIQLTDFRDLFVLETWTSVLEMNTMYYWSPKCRLTASKYMRKDRQPHNISIGEIGNSQFIHSLDHFQFYHFGFALWSSVITNFILSLDKQIQTHTHTNTNIFLWMFSNFRRNSSCGSVSFSYAMPFLIISMTITSTIL